jgi:kynurenine formamidase
MPTQDEVLGYFNTLSNWGRWGDDDELGTLNHITDDVRVAAARAVRHGRSVSCAWEVAVPEDMERSTTTCPCAADMPGAEDMPVPGFRNDRRWGFSSERLGITFHGNTITHVDSPCHIFWDGTMYNGRSHSLVDAATGSAWAAVTAAANGIITRGVLLDIARVRDVPWLEPGQGVFPDDLEEAERRQGVRVRSGDAVLLRTGYGRVRHETGEASGFTQAGWHASCLPWLHERQVALIGADTPQDVQPSGYEDVLMPVHAVSLVAMGLWLLERLGGVRDDGCRARPVGLPPRRRAGPLGRYVRQPGQPDRYILTAVHEGVRCHEGPGPHLERHSCPEDHGKAAHCRQTRLIRTDGPRSPSGGDRSGCGACRPSSSIRNRCRVGANTPEQTAGPVCRTRTAAVAVRAHQADPEAEHPISGMRSGRFRERR